jgi:crotonobetainyl-CoA:carnitine CoA-transferase CaiB-like acyl-CoA transferase
MCLRNTVAAKLTTFDQLADLGARVIKIERTGSGDFARQYDEAVAGQASYFVWLNRSKESVAVDVKSPQGQKILQSLVDRADVIVQNLGPGAAQRLGLSAVDVHAKDPSKIILNITGWGSTGPWAHRKAYDLLVQCETGLVSLTGTPSEPSKVGISIADIAAGMYGFSSVLAALYRRLATGEGADIEVSLFEALAEWVGQPAHYTAGAGRQPGRFGAQHPTIAPYGPFTASDGHVILIAIQNEPEWERFSRTVLGRPDLIDDERFRNNTQRVAYRDDLNTAIEKRFSELTTPELEGVLSEARIAFAGVNTVAEFLDHPVLAQRDRWRTVVTPAGNVRALLPPVSFGGEPRMGPVPSLGQHTHDVLSELGFSAVEVARVVHDGAVATQAEVSQ